MKFHFFSKGEKHIPSSRYRAYYLAEALIELGHEAVVTPVTDLSFGALPRYLNMFFSLPQSDVVYLQRPIYNKYFFVAFFIAWLFGRRFIFDFDDAVYKHTLFRTAFFTRYAALVTCGSEKIREWALKHNPKSFTLANSIPLSIYTMRANEPAGRPVIGWIGTKPHLVMTSAIPALHELVAHGRDFELKIIGTMGDRTIEKSLEGIPNVTIIDSLNWADPREAVREIQSFTIGIMPLGTDAWDQVRYFKALEYMACGVPTVASSATTVRSILEDSGAGLVASSTEEWVAHLLRLLDDPALRMRLGARGRAAIEQEYSNKAIAQKLVALVLEQYPGVK